jgi:NTP pyrophosphatase (non-canonical NTP hydrolase)
MPQLKQLTDLLIQFRDARDWKQFHNPKDLAIAISIESSELVEAFLWKSAESVPVEKVKDEIADVFAYLIMLADHYNLDLEQIVREKVKQNEVKYPVDKAKGKSTKYNEL